MGVWVVVAVVVETYFFINVVPSSKRLTITKTNLIMQSMNYKQALGVPPQENQSTYIDNMYLTYAAMYVGMMYVCMYAEALYVYNNVCTYMYV